MPLSRQQAIVGRGRVTVAGGSDVDGTPSIGGEGSLAWRTRIGNRGDYLALGVTYRSWAGFSAMHGIPWPLLEYRWQAGNWSGLFGAPRLNLHYTESAYWSHSWQTVVDLGGLAWSEYTLMLPGETWGLRCTGEVSLTYHPEVREEPLSQFRHVISAQLIYQAPGSWSGLRISAGPSYFGPQRWYRDHIEKVDPFLRFDASWGGTMTLNDERLTPTEYVRARLNDIEPLIMTQDFAHVRRFTTRCYRSPQRAVGRALRGAPSQR